MSSAGTTNTTTAAPTVLAVGCPSELVARCASALAEIGAVIKECGIAAAVNVAVERQPLVILMLEDVFAFDPDEFTALARDLRSSLVKVDPDIAEEALAGLLRVAIARALSRRDERTSTGRYAIISLPAVEVMPQPTLAWSPQSLSTPPSSRPSTRSSSARASELDDVPPSTRRGGSMAAPRR